MCRNWRHWIFVTVVACALAAAISAPLAASSASATADEKTPQAADSGEKAPPPENKSAEKGAAAPAQATEEGEGSSETAADGERLWLFDETSGRRYSVERVPKIEGTYIWRDEKHIRLPGGLLNVEVVKHDDKWFWVKLWEPPKRKKRTPPPKGPTPEEIEAAKAAYETNTETVDRLRLLPFDNGLPKAGQWREGFDIADMNKDGHLDIVFGPSRKGRLLPNIFLGDSKGNWQRWREVRYPPLAYDYGDAVAADFNGDGHMDLALGVHLRGMLAMISDGEGGFEPWMEGIAFDDPRKAGKGNAYSSRAVEAIDWNEDGKKDLLAFGEGPKGFRAAARGPNKKNAGGVVEGSRGLVVYINKGDGTWSSEYIENEPRDFGDDFALGDFDGDGQRDIAVASRVQGNRAILRTTSSGEDGLLGAETIEAVRPRGRVTSVAASDFDGDGDDDLLVSFIAREGGVWRTGIDLFLANSEKGWERRGIIARESNSGVPSMALGDLDGDKATDLVALTGSGEVWMFLGDGAGAFDLEATPETPKPIAGCSGAKVRLVDLDGDGGREIVASFAGEPTGPLGIPNGSFPGCPGQGNIRAWKVALTTESASSDSAAD